MIATDARGSELIEVDDVNHNGFLENAPVYNQAIAAFFAAAATSAVQAPEAATKTTASILARR